MTHEDVIKGLECLAKRHGIVGVCEPESCPYGDLHTCANKIARDVLTLLKAQEPRVMTLEEVKAAAEHDVWIELSGNFADDVLFAATIEGCGTKGLCTRYESHNYSAYGIKPYGWRCWTSRPTDEQMEATPWN